MEEEYQVELKELRAKLKEKDKELAAQLKEKEELAAQVKEKDEKLAAQMKEKEELAAQVKEKDEELEELAVQLLRSSIKSKIVNGEILTYDQLLDAIKKAKFSATVVNNESIVNTDYIIRDKSSVSSKSSVSTKTESDVIQMNKFDRKQVAETEHQMNVVLLDIPLEKFIRERYKGFSGFSNIFDEVTADLEKIRECLRWLDQNGDCFGEVFTQQVFIIYCSGLLHRFGSIFEVFAINGIELDANITVKNDVGIIDKRLVGNSDVAVGLMATEGFGIDEVISSTTSLVELKKSFGPLSKHKSKIRCATNQLLAQLFAISQMREISGLVVPVHKSVLCDLFFMRIILRIENNDEVLFPITTMYFEASDFVACILFLTFDFSVSDILPHINLNPHVQDSDDEAETNAEEDHEEPRNLLLHINHINRTVSEKRCDGNDGRQDKTKRRPLGTRDESILLMDEDLLDEANERRLQNLQYIAEWDACRLGYAYLSSTNLQCKDRVV